MSCCFTPIIISYLLQSQLKHSLTSRLNTVLVLLVLDYPTSYKIFRFSYCFNSFLKTIGGTLPPLIRCKFQKVDCIQVIQIQNYPLTIEFFPRLNPIIHALVLMIGVSYSFLSLVASVTILYMVSMVYIVIYFVRQQNILKSIYSNIMKEIHIVKQFMAKYLIRSSRGDGLISQASDPFRDVLDGTVYMFAIKGLFGIEISAQMLFLIVIIKKIVGYSAGYFDEKIGFWKYENDYASREINPFNKELLNRVKNIETIIKTK